MPSRGTIKGRIKKCRVSVGTSDEKICSRLPVARVRLLFPTVWPFQFFTEDNPLGPAFTFLSLFSHFASLLPCSRRQDSKRHQLIWQAGSRYDLLWRTDESNKEKTSCSGRNLFVPSAPLIHLERIQPDLLSAHYTMTTPEFQGFSSLAQFNRTNQLILMRPRSRSYWPMPVSIESNRKLPDLRTLKAFGENLVQLRPPWNLNSFKVKHDVEVNM